MAREVDGERGWTEIEREAGMEREDEGEKER